MIIKVSSTKAIFIQNFSLLILPFSPSFFLLQHGHSHCDSYNYGSLIHTSRKMPEEKGEKSLLCDSLMSLSCDPRKLIQQQYQQQQMELTNWSLVIKIFSYHFNKTMRIFFSLLISVSSNKMDFFFVLILLKYL